MDNKEVYQHMNLASALASSGVFLYPYSNNISFALLTLSGGMSLMSFIFLYYNFLYFKTGIKYDHKKCEDDQLKGKDDK